MAKIGQISPVSCINSTFSTEWCSMEVLKLRFFSPRYIKMMSEAMYKGRVGHVLKAVGFKHCGCCWPWRRGGYPADSGHSECGPRGSPHCSGSSCGVENSTVTNWGRFQMGSWQKSSAVNSENIIFQSCPAVTHLFFIPHWHCIYKT